MKKTVLEVMKEMCQKETKGEIMSANDDGCDSEISNSDKLQYNTDEEISQGGELEGNFR